MNTGLCYFVCRQGGWDPHGVWAADNAWWQVSWQVRCEHLGGKSEVERNIQRFEDLCTTCTVTGFQHACKVFLEILTWMTCLSLKVIDIQKYTKVSFSALAASGLMECEKTEKSMECVSEMPWVWYITIHDYVYIPYMDMVSHTRVRAPHL